MKFWKLAFAASLLATGLHAAQEPINAGCSLASLSGNYGALWSGIGSGPNDTGHFAMVAAFAANGQGKITSINGTASMQTLTRSVRQMTGSGTYTVSPDCTGTATLNLNGDTIHLGFVLINNGARGLVVRADKYAFMSGEIDKQ